MSSGTSVAKFPLHFAILDGSDPTKWSIFGKSFPKLMREAGNVSPFAVDPQNCRYSVSFEPIWCSPDELLQEERTEHFVGAIIDAWPKDTLEKDLKEKKEKLAHHLAQIRKNSKRDVSPAFERFEYSVWFITNDASTITPYRQDFNFAIAAVIDKTPIFQYFTDERILMAHLATYLSNIYLILERGR